MHISYLISMDVETEESNPVDGVDSKAFLRLSGEIQGVTFRLCLPYVFINKGFPWAILNRELNFITYSNWKVTL